MHELFQIPFSEAISPGALYLIFSFKCFAQETTFLIYSDGKNEKP